MSRPRKTPAEMFPLIEAYLQSPLTQKAFCHKHALSLPVLNYWIQRYRQQHPAPKVDSSAMNSFVEITPMHVADGSIREQALIEVIYPHGVRLRLFQPTDTATLTQLVHLA